MREFGEVRSLVLRFLSFAHEGDGWRFLQEWVSKVHFLSWRGTLVWLSGLKGSFEKEYGLLCPYWYVPEAHFFGHGNIFTFWDHGYEKRLFCFQLIKIFNSSSMYYF